MKSLVEFILESKKREEVRVEIKGLDGADELLSNLRSLLNEKKIYNEEIDKGLKFALQGEDGTKYTEVVTLLRNFKSEEDVLNGAIQQVEDWCKSLEDEKMAEQEKKNKEEE